ncbi:hypothetical protein BpHYR1_016240 [Brachionus plicatilis]|uniref:Uncharacterized protein n=1 Tax=Brachionus plicatilis TaxID=10195 RepID=A0A3M7RIP5_BRAPC|nr:hypothetical protein BpHYR1_016240 [Brachionus plicatilis]
MENYKEQSKFHPNLSIYNSNCLVSPYNSGFFCELFGNLQKIPYQKFENSEKEILIIINFQSCIKAIFLIQYFELTTQKKMDEISRTKNIKQKATYAYNK